MLSWLLFTTIVLLILLSLWLRVKQSRIIFHDTLNEVKDSPFSLAVRNLVGVAGGIYVAVVMIASFIKIDIPALVSIAGISFDPLAMVALGLAILQPLIIYIRSRWLR